MRAVRLALACCLAAVGCDLDHPCDPGYYEDHGGCYLRDAGAYDADAAVSGEDAEVGERPDVGFGTPCSSSRDCGGRAPVCGGMMFPECTAVNCSSAVTDICPDGWTCLDVTKYSTDPAVTSACVAL
jgi:hypothetical protein